MSSNLIEVAKRSMEPNDGVQRTYPGRVDGKYGYLVLTKNKMMFIREDGFLSKKYSVVFSLPYDNIKDYFTKQMFNLEIVDTSNNRKVFVSEVAASMVRDALKPLITDRKAAIPAS